MAEKIQVNIEDRDKLVELFGKINIENYDHDTGAEFALFTRLLKLKAIREKYNINTFLDILNFYAKNGLSLNESLSDKKDMSAKIYSFLTYIFTLPENSKQDNNTIVKKQNIKQNGVIEAQTEQQIDERMKDIKENIISDMKKSIDENIEISNYKDEDVIVNGIGCEKCYSGYIQRVDGSWGFCDCYIKDVFKTRFRKSGIPEKYIIINSINDEVVELCALKNYSKEDTSYKGIILSSFVNKYINNIDKMFLEGWNLIIEGPTGALKTTTACLIGKESIKRGKTVLFTEMQQLRKLWTGEKLSQELEEYKNKVYSVDLLILDDFGQEFMSNHSDYQLAELDYLFRERLSNNKMFIITTNANKEQIEKRYSQRISSLLNTKMMHLFIKTKQDLRKTEDLPDIF